VSAMAAGAGVVAAYPCLLTRFDGMWLLGFQCGVNGPPKWVAEIIDFNLRGYGL
jgi:hypothetical protein